MYFGAAIGDNKIKT